MFDAERARAPQPDETLTPSVNLSPEQRLVAAIILQGVRDYATEFTAPPPTSRQAAVRKRERVEALLCYFFDEHDYEWSFTYHCQCIWQDWEGVREKVRAFLRAGDFSRLRMS